MSGLPLVMSFPVHRLLRCPRLMESMEEAFDVPLDLITETFYDMLEMSKIEPESCPPFHWFIVTEDEQDEDLLWFVAETGFKLGIKLDEYNDSDDRTKIAKIQDVEFETISALSMSITNAIREKLGDDSLVLELKQIPMPSNNYLFSKPGVMVGEYRASSEESFRPYVAIQRDGKYKIFLSEDEFAVDFFITKLQGALDCDDANITFETPPNKENNYLEIGPGMAEGAFKLDHWEDYEDFIFLYDPEDDLDCEVILPYLAASDVIMDHISNAMECEPEEISLIEEPNKANNYLSAPTNESITIAPFRYNNTEYIAVIEPTDDGENMITTVYPLNEESFSPPVETDDDVITDYISNATGCEPEEINLLDLWKDES